MEEHLASKAGYESGDLITAGDVKPVLARLAKLGLSVEAKEQGVTMLLPDNHPLPKLLKTSAGLKFMRQMKAHPDVWDRLERLVQFNEGRKLVEQLIATENVTAAAELAHPAAAQRLTAAFPNQPHCWNLEVRSGRTYTLDQYLGHLRTMHTLAERNLSRPGE